MHSLSPSSSFPVSLSPSPSFSLIYHPLKKKVLAPPGSYSHCSVNLIVSWGWRMSRRDSGGC